MDESGLLQRKAVRAALEASRNHPQPLALIEALLLTGVTVQEEKKGALVDVFYEPAFFDSQVERMTPKVVAFLEQQARDQAAATEEKAGNAGKGASEEEAVPEGWDSEELKAMQWLSTPPAPGRLHPDIISGQLTSEQLAEEEQENQAEFFGLLQKLSAG
jgi:hypothetical protein